MSIASVGTGGDGNKMVCDMDDHGVHGEMKVRFLSRCPPPPSFPPPQRV
jgi:hypothetical protein